MASDTSFLAFRAVVAASPSDDYALDRSPAYEAGFAFTAIHPMLQLKKALGTVRTHVVGDRRATQ